MAKTQAAALVLKPETPEGYTPKEAAAVVAAAGFPTDGKKIRRLLRKNQLDGVQFSGRWYIPVKAVEDLVNRLNAKPEQTEAPAAA